MSYAEYEMKVLQWSEQKKIIPNSTPLAQWKKAAEELDELKDALKMNDKYEAIDAIGDTVVCLINICALLDVNLTDCLAAAYEEIKNRTGHMGTDGIFYKDK